MKAGISGRSGDLALSEVVGFVLLLGVIVAAMALWMMYVVPAEGREDEIAQMNAVKDRFTDYKITLDSLWINSNDPSVPTMSGVMVSTSFNLGTPGGSTSAGGLFLPLMKPVASPATLTLTSTNDRMTIKSLGGTVDMNGSYPINKIEYQSQNYYWIQQKYYYQAGGVFLEQDNGSTTRVAPPISIINSSAGAATPAEFNSSVTVAPISLEGGASIGGNGPVRVDTRLKSIQRALGPDRKYWVNISVSVPDYKTARMWNATFLEALDNEGIPDWWYVTGTSEPGDPAPAVAFVYIKGPFDDTTHGDVWFTLHPAEYAVTFNNIATGIT
ncbi:MAG: hypothetical protein GYA23_00510 [Methanomicrobiales archaeon]|nr:hypothetical protein [Methanomicrobiales archaeon]